MAILAAIVDQWQYNDFNITFAVAEQVPRDTFNSKRRQLVIHSFVELLFEFPVMTLNQVKIFYSIVWTHTYTLIELT